MTAPTLRALIMMIIATLLASAGWPHGLPSASAQEPAEVSGPQEALPAPAEDESEASAEGAAGGPDGTSTGTAAPESAAPAIDAPPTDSTMSAPVRTRKPCAPYPDIAEVEPGLYAIEPVTAKRWRDSIKSLQKMASADEHRDARTGLVGLRIRPRHCSPLLSAGLRNRDLILQMNGVHVWRVVRLQLIPFFRARVVLHTARSLRWDILRRGERITVRWRFREGEATALNAAAASAQTE